jgi:hypothetical protein
MVCPAEILVVLLPSAPLTMPWGRRHCTTRTGHPCASAQQRNKESISISRMAPTHRKPRCLSAACVVLMACQVQFIAAVRATHRVVHGHALALDDHHLARPCHAAGCQCDLVSIQVLDLRVMKHCSTAVCACARSRTGLQGTQSLPHLHGEAHQGVHQGYRHVVVQVRPAPLELSVRRRDNDKLRSRMSCHLGGLHSHSHPLRSASISRACSADFAGITDDRRQLTFRSPGSPSTVGSPCSKNEISCRRIAVAYR